jgi:hypothetical protein
MDGFDAGVTCEVFFVESQNPFHGVHSHGRDQSRVVNLDAGDMVRDQEFSPFLMRRRNFSSKKPARRPASSGDSPYPLRSSGRVQVFQNSATFCDV